MLEFISRTGKIAYILFDNPQGITMQRLADKLGISSNTLSKELKRLEESLPNDWELKKNSRVGVKLISPIGGKIEDLWRNLNESNEILSLVKDILELEECTTTYLVNKYECSRATLYRKIKLIQTWLLDYEVFLETTPIYYLSGDERKIRAMMIQFYDIYYPGELYMSDFSGYFNISNFKSQLNNIVLSQNIYLSVEETRRLVLLMHIMHIRAHFQKYIPDFNKQVRSSGIYFEISNHLFYFFPKYPNNEIMKNEYSFFSLNLYVGSRPKNRQEEIWLIRDFKSKDPRFQWVFSFLEHFSSHFYYDFSNDDQLIYDLAFFITRIHTDAMLLTNTRSNHLIPYSPHFDSDPLLPIIKKSVSDTKEILPRWENSTLDRTADLMQLLLLIRASLERLKVTIRINVSIVCNTMLEYTVLYSELKYRHNERLDIRYVEAIHVDQLKLTPVIDFVISTVKLTSLDVPHLPVINIGSIPDEKDHRLIKEYIESFIKRKISKEVKEW